MNAPPSTPDAPRPVSPARLEANRLNAQKSTGPRTDEGRRRSRLNSLKHGLTARVVDFAADDARRAARRESLRSIFKPTGEWGEFACDQAAHASVQVERAAENVEAAAESASVVAESVEKWAEIRQAEVARVARRLPRDPAQTVSALMDCPHGIDWLIAQWQLLRMSVEKGDGWDGPQVSLALDLLRLPRDQRIIAPIGAFLLLHPGEEAPASMGELCRRMIARLTAARELAEELDECKRLSTVAGTTDQFAPEVRRLRRYESGLHRRLQWLVGILQAGQEVSAVEVGPEARPVVPAPPPIGRQNEPKPVPQPPPASETKPIPPPPSPLKLTAIEPIDPPRTQQNSDSGPKHRPDPARMLRRDRKRRRRA